MPHTLTPNGRWRKEISMNDPGTMADPGHYNNQITPDEYIAERYAETGGDSIIDEKYFYDPQRAGKFDRQRFLEKYESALTNSAYLHDVSQNTDMYSAYKMDEVIQEMKRRGELDDPGRIGGSQIHIPQANSLSSMTSNLQQIKYGEQGLENQRQQSQQPRYDNMVSMAQRIADKHKNIPTIKPNKINVQSREHLKQVLANKQKTGFVQNPYKKKTNI